MLRLASHFKAEAAVLQAAAIEAWPQLAALTDADLRRLASTGRASEQRLIKLRGQARLVVQVGLEPEEAALLLYAGIASAQGLAEASHHQLLVQFCVLLFFLLLYLFLHVFFFIALMMYLFV